MPSTPEIVDLGNFLNAMGARVSGHGTDTVTIEGVASLSGARHQVMPDRVETGTYLIAAAATRGDIRLTHTRPAALESVLIKLAETGAVIEEGDDWVSLDMRGQRPQGRRRHQALHRPPPSHLPGRRGRQAGMH